MKKFNYVILMLSFVLSSCSYQQGETAFEEKTLENLSVSLDEYSSNNGSDDNTDQFINEVTDSFEGTDFPLFAMIEEADIYLYGVKPYGMILYYKGKGSYFDWAGLTPHAVLPEMAYYDYDNDGEKELAVTLYVGSGTGYSIMELHILKIKEDQKLSWLKPTYTDYSITVDNLNEWFLPCLNVSTSDQHDIADLMFNDNDYKIKISKDISDSGKMIGIGYGDVVNFFLEESTIRVNISIGFSYENWATPQYFGDIVADVTFNGEKFILSEYNLLIDEDRIVD